MKRFVTMLSVILLAAGLAESAQASPSYDKMVGTWKWEGFTIQVNKCDKTGVCAKVISGPKNVGLQMIKSRLTKSGDNFVGKVAHPQTGDTYNSKITMVSANVWHIDGCTVQNVCASGDFKRVK